MNINGKHYHTIWVKENNPETIQIIDQRSLPFEFKIKNLKTIEDTFQAIKEMWVRGAPLIGVTAAYGMYLGLLGLRDNNNLKNQIIDFAKYLESSRPTAVNLKYALDMVLEKISGAESLKEKTELAFKTANQLKANEIENCRLIGKNGFQFIEKISKAKKGETVNILTHCNAGWLACVDYGTATAPIYLAHEKGIKIHVWVDETRPRNQGARLTAYELEQQGVPHTVITDNTGGLLMQKGLVDMVVVGSDRTSANGDVANKIGTYLKALAAYDNKIPFYVALPLSTIDWNINDGIKEIPIEERDHNEVKYVEGWNKNEITKVRIMPENSPVANYGFDITPSKYVTALITEKGVCGAKKQDVEKMRIEEGYIKFNLSWEEKSFDFSDEDFHEINSYRQKLYEAGFIGAYTNGIGFGNLSVRYNKKQFIISGSATGNFKNLSKDHFALVKDFDISKNNIQCVGLTKASSESLSHAAIYNSNPEVNAVIHIHHKGMWNTYLNDLPTTNKKAEFGTPEIAIELAKLANLPSGIIIMGGHPEGIISYGKTFNEALEILLKYYHK